jgi:hypothetical protein
MNDRELLHAVLWAIGAELDIQFKGLDYAYGDRGVNLSTEEFEALAPHFDDRGKLKEEAP